MLETLQCAVAYQSEEVVFLANQRRVKSNRNLTHKTFSRACHQRQIFDSNNDWFISQFVVKARVYFYNIH